MAFSPNQPPSKERSDMIPKPKDPERLFFPCEIADDIGLKKNEVNALKRRGCPFYGRKTTIRWVRDFIAREVAAIPPVSEQVSGAACLSGRR